MYAKIRKIIPKLSLLPLLIWSSAVRFNPFQIEKDTDRLGAKRYVYEFILLEHLGVQKPR